MRSPLSKKYGLLEWPRPLPELLEPVALAAAPDSDVVDPATGRADKSRTSPEKLLEQGRKILKPYKMEMKDGKVAWWTVYVGACFRWVYAHARGW